ncbi:MAG: methionine--tRNA ligase [Candidatus Babeliales bacterium]
MSIRRTIFTCQWYLRDSKSEQVQRRRFVVCLNTILSFSFSADMGEIMALEKKFYVTTPIYYVTAKPHLGTLYSTLIADVLNRWHQLKGEKTFFLTGTDEHGQKIAQAAAKAGKEPKSFVDGFIDAYRQMWKRYDIKYTKFIRTTDPDHIKAVQAWIVALQKSGDIYKGEYSGWYCIHCETYLTEVPEGAQHPPCNTCNRPTEFIREESYFFKLSAYAQRLIDFYTQNPHFINPPERLHEVISFVKSGLKDLSISRTTIQWGIPFPGDDKHVVYVWADALNNYISAVGYADPARTQEFNFWWPADVQVLGKDIVRFHTVFWPAFLMATGLQLPKKLLVHGWIKVGEHKMSKSLGNAIDPDELVSQYGPDCVRYYLMRYLAITHDSQFSIPDLEQRVNTDLANDLGNLLNRTLVLAHKQGLNIVPAPHLWSEQSLQLRDTWWNTLEEYSQLLDDGMIHSALAVCWQFVHAVNSYFHAREPWKQSKTDEQGFIETIAATCHALEAVALLLWPIMPQKMHLMLQALGVELKIGAPYIEQLKLGAWNRTYILMMIQPLFQRIEPKAAEPVFANPGPQARLATPGGAKGTDGAVVQTSAAAATPQPVQSETSITIDEFAKVALHVGLIQECHEVPQSEKLWRLMVDFGQLGVRQILSGIKKAYAAQELIGRKAIFVTNLAPRAMMGFQSHGMLLAANDSTGKPIIMQPLSDVPAGTRLK